MDHPTSLFDLFPQWAVTVGIVIEFIISLFFVYAWIYSLAMARESRKDAHSMRQALDRFVAWFEGPPPEDGAVSILENPHLGENGRPQDAAVDPSGSRPPHDDEDDDPFGPEEERIRQRLQNRLTKPRRRPKEDPPHGPR